MKISNCIYFDYSKNQCSQEIDCECTTDCKQFTPKDGCSSCKHSKECEYIEKCEYPTFNLWEPKNKVANTELKPIGYIPDPKLCIGITPPPNDPTGIGGPVKPLPGCEVNIDELVEILNKEPAQIQIAKGFPSLEQFLNWLMANCRIIYVPNSGDYPIEHYLPANKDNTQALLWMCASHLNKKGKDEITGNNL